MRHVELDRVFWQRDLEPLPPAQWAAVRAQLLSGEAWIAYGDLGPYDVLEVRLRRADAVVILDMPLRICIWRSLRRSREGADYWRWLLAWKRRYGTALLRAVAEQEDKQLFVVRHPRELPVVIDAVLSRRAR